MEKDENFVLDPNNIPGVDYYLEGCPNHSEELTIEGFCRAANALTRPFGEAWKKSTELMYGKRTDKT